MFPWMMATGSLYVKPSTCGGHQREPRPSGGTPEPRPPKHVDTPFSAARGAAGRPSGGTGRAGGPAPADAGWRATRARPVDAAKTRCRPRPEPTEQGTAAREARRNRCARGHQASARGQRSPEKGLEHGRGARIQTSMHERRHVLADDPMHAPVEGIAPGRPTSTCASSGACAGRHDRARRSDEGDSSSGTCAHRVLVRPDAELPRPRRQQRLGNKLRLVARRRGERGCAVLRVTPHIAPVQGTGRARAACRRTARAKRGRACSDALRTR